jgi:hypothetical protein
MLAAEACSIYDMVKSRLDSNKAELIHLEEAVEEQMNAKKPKKRAKKAGKKSESGGTGSSKADDAFMGGLPAETELNLSDIDFSESD